MLRATGRGWKRGRHLALLLPQSVLVEWSLVGRWRQLEKKCIAFCEVNTAAHELVSGLGVRACVRVIKVLGLALVSRLTLQSAQEVRTKCLSDLRSSAHVHDPPPLRQLPPLVGAVQPCSVLPLVPRVVDPATCRS